MFSSIDMKKHFTEEAIQVVNRPMKSFSSPLATREMQSKNMRYNYLLLRRLSKNGVNIKCWQRYREPGSLMHCWWECKMGWPLWKTHWQFLLNLKVKLPHDPKCIFGHVSKNNENLFSHRNLHVNNHGSFVHSGPKLNVTPIPFNGLQYLNTVGY